MVLLPHPAPLKTNSQGFTWGPAAPTEFLHSGILCSLQQQLRKLCFFASASGETKILWWAREAQPAAPLSCPQPLHKQLQLRQVLTKCQQIAQHHHAADVTACKGWHCAPPSTVQFPLRPSLASGKGTHDIPFEIITENMAWPLWPLLKAVDRQNRSWKFVLLGPRTQKWRRQLYPFPWA